MDSDAEEIFVGRLRQDINVKNIKDTPSLLREIDSAPDSYTTRKGKVVSLTHAKDNLKRFVEDLISGSGTLQENLFNNNKEDIRSALTKKEVEDVIDRVKGIPRISNSYKVDIERVGVEREREILKEQPMALSRAELMDLGYYNRSLRKASNELGLSQEDARRLFEREGFAIDERGQIRR